MAVKDGMAEKCRKLTYKDSIVTVTAGKYVYLENCCRIIEYNDIRIAVELTDFQLHIWGKDLRADTCSGNTLIIQGDIQSVEWIKKRGGKR